MESISHSISEGAKTVAAGTKETITYVLHNPAMFAFLAVVGFVLFFSRN